MKKRKMKEEHPTRCKQVISERLATMPSELEAVELENDEIVARLGYEFL
jgi:hypothetical protein